MITDKRRTFWNAPTSQDVASRRAGGRRRYNSHRKLLVLLRRRMILLLVMREKLDPLAWGFQAAMGRRLRVGKATIWSDTAALFFGRCERSRHPDSTSP